MQIGVRDPPYWARCCMVEPWLRTVHGHFLIDLWRCVLCSYTWQTLFSIAQHLLPVGNCSLSDMVLHQFVLLQVATGAVIAQVSCTILTESESVAGHLLEKDAIFFPGAGWLDTEKWHGEVLRESLCFRSSAFGLATFCVCLGCSGVRLGPGLAQSSGANHLRVQTQFLISCTALELQNGAIGGTPARWRRMPQPSCCCLCFWVCAMYGP